MAGPSSWYAKAVSGEGKCQQEHQQGQENETGGGATAATSGATAMTPKTAAASKLMPIFTQKAGQPSGVAPKEGSALTSGITNNATVSAANDSRAAQARRKLRQSLSLADMSTSKRVTADLVGANEDQGRSLKRTLRRLENQGQKHIEHHSTRIERAHFRAIAGGCHSAGHGGHVARQHMTGDASRPGTACTGSDRGKPGAPAAVGNRVAGCFVKVNPAVGAGAAAQTVGGGPAVITGYGSQLFGPGGECMPLAV